MKPALILVLALILRLILVGQVPPGVSHDELEFIENGISLVHTGKDLSGESLPLTVGGQGHVALPAYIAGLSALIFGQSVAGVRVFVVLMGATNVCLLYFIARRITSQKAALFASLAYAISPWGIHFARIMYDPPVALFLALAGIAVLVYSTKALNIALGWAFLGLSVISYYGFIFVVPLVAILLAWYKRKELDKNGLIFGVVVLSLSYLLLAGMVPRSRKTELIFLQPEKLAQRVIFERSISLAPEVLDRIFVNKGTVALGEVSANYLSAFAPESLFSFGEASQILSLQGFGFAYLFDLPLIIVGAYSLYIKNKKGALLVFFVILVSPVTMAISDERTYAARASLMFPFLLLLVGVGIERVLEWSKKYKFSFQTGLLFVGLYILSLSAFLYQYLFRYPVYARELWNDSERRIAEYLLNNSQKEIVVATVEPRETFMEYLFYSKLDPVEAQSAYRLRAPIFVKNIIFSDCSSPDNKPEDAIFILDSECGINLTYADVLIKSEEGAKNTRWGIWTE
jgi:4-amino-4-deoxy-L-arabinose transferase-like glycosyltransferase